MLHVFVHAFKLENTFRHKLLYTYKHDSVQPDKSLALINYENVLYMHIFNYVNQQPAGFLHQTVCQSVRTVQQELLIDLLRP